MTPSFHQTQFCSGCYTVLFHAALNTTGSVSTTHFYWFSLWCCASNVGRRKRKKKKRKKNAFAMISVSDFLSCYSAILTNSVCVCLHHYINWTHYKALLHSNWTLNNILFLPKKKAGLAPVINFVPEAKKAEWRFLRFCVLLLHRDCLMTPMIKSAAVSVQEQGGEVYRQNSDKSETLPVVVMKCTYSSACHHLN